jgi:NTP pyrophosphatase (non-canonical NTP hydrolase)
VDYNLYQTMALKTAIYPNQGKNLAYTALGLTEEIGEAYDKVLHQDSDGLLKELGDILWYISVCASEIKVSLKDVGEQRNLIITKPVPELFSDLYSQASVISGRAKKVLRDNQGEVPDDKKEVIKKSLGQCLVLINLISQTHGSSLEEVAKMNLEKLQKRQNSGHLKGDGDNR